MISGGYAALIALLAVLPPTPGLSVGRLDKAAHLCEYALFAWCLRRAATASAVSRPRAFLIAFCVSTLYGGLLELVQGGLGYRSAEWGDALANAIGAALGTWINRDETAA